MKKKLLVAIAVILSAAANAQPTVIPTGHLPNAMSAAGKSRTNLWYDQDILTLTFIHTSDPAFTSYPSGYFVFDVSFDNGNSWNPDQGPIYVDSSGTGMNAGLYPTAVISNTLVSSNTDPSNSNIVYNGPWTNGSGYHGQVYGTTNFAGNTAATQSHDSLSYASLPGDMFMVKNTGDIWKVGSMVTNNTANTYLDSIVVTHGIAYWDSSNYPTLPAVWEFNYYEQHVHVPVNHDYAALYPNPILDMSVAFNDSGNVGYIAMILNNDHLYYIYPDSTFYLSVLKTTDGGQTWSYDNPCSIHPEIIDVYRSLDSVLANNPLVHYGVTGDLDLVVDANNELHIITGVAPSRSFQVGAFPGAWGMFDIYSSGSTWKAQLLDKPKTYKGTFGSGSVTHPTLNEYNRPFATRSWDGTKLFFSWFDTDPLVYGTPNNLHPDLHTIGYDVTTQMWTDTMNLTMNSAAAGLCTFGNGSYYAIEPSANTFSIPVVFQADSASPASFAYTGSPAALNYLKDANVDMTTATLTKSPVTLVCSPTAVTAPEHHSFAVSSNYPNPFNGKTQFDVVLSSTSDVSVEVSNLMGQVISSEHYSNLPAGVHTLALDGRKLSAGVYFYQVKAGNDQVTRKMTVK